MTAAEIARAHAAALSLGRCGRKCFPCTADKRPTTPHGFKDAVSGPEKIRELWRRYPGPLVGVATGEASDIDVLDLDCKHTEAAEWWRAHRHRLPQTRIHRTRSGGLHLVFRHRPGVRCWTGAPLPGIDGRADGGYAIWWPAIGLPVLSDAPLAPWPAWLFPERRPSRSLMDRRITVPDGHALAGLVRRVAGASEGERNALAFWAACRAGEMAASGVLGEDTAAAVIAHAATLSGLPRAEAERTAWSGIRRGRGNAPCA
jgi:hypothetical protein